MFVVTIRSVPQAATLGVSPQFLPLLTLQPITKSWQSCFKSECVSLFPCPPSTLAPHLHWLAFPGLLRPLVARLPDNGHVTLLSNLYWGLLPSGHKCALDWAVLDRSKVSTRGMWNKVCLGKIWQSSPKDLDSAPWFMHRYALIVYSVPELSMVPGVGWRRQTHNNNTIW